MDNLSLFLHDQFVGVVTRNVRDKSRVILNIDRNYHDEEIALSLAFQTVPGREMPTGPVSNFLGSYVPEGNQRERMAVKRHIDRDDLFALLSEFGGSIAGAVTLKKPNKDAENVSNSDGYEHLDDTTLATKLKQAIVDSDQGIPDDSRSALPGYQPKVLVAEFDGGWYYPHGNSHSTYILKPQVPSRPTRIFDEHYSHLLTQAMSMADYRSEIRTAEDTTYLAIERFDREVSGDQIHLRHQEDLSSVLSLVWQDSDIKFQDPTWPNNPKRASAKKIAEDLGLVNDKGVAIREWIKYLTYQIAIGDNDAHAKNLALMHLPSGTKLAPIYDSIPNLFQEGRIQWNLALSINGEFDHRRITVEHILAEIKSWQLISATVAEDIVSSTLKNLSEALNTTEIPEGVSPGMPEKVAQNVRLLAEGKEIGAME